MTPAPRTVPDALERRLRADAGRPLVTFYDDATGERIELSVATYANWVAKTAGLVQDELDVEPGSLVVLDLPTHWLGAVWLGAAWSLGVAVTDDAGLLPEAALVVCGPDRLTEHADRAAHSPVVALSLRPLGGRFTDALPAGVVDYGAVVLAQPDAFVPLEPVRADDVAWRDGEGTATQADLLAEAVAASTVEPGGRLLTDVDPCSRAGLSTLLAPLVRDGSTVWVRHADPGRWPSRAAQEQATDLLRS
jgi:uncharacterized protein (TIGR03089 family)